MNEKAPHVPAAFINAIAEEGTKDEAIQYLQETWNELCEANESLRRWYAAALPWATPDALQAALSARTEARDKSDTARLDALEKDVNDNGPLLLHNLRTPGGAFRGLGLACTKRTLRKAIDDMTYANVEPVSPPRRNDGKVPYCTRHGFVPHEHRCATFSDEPWQVIAAHEPQSNTKE